MSNTASGYVPCPNTDQILAGLEFHYGIPPSAFDDWRFWSRMDSGVVSLAPADHEPGDGVYESFGMMMVRRDDHPAAAGTAFVRRFGHLATRNTVQLEGAALANYLQGLPVDSGVADERRGFVIVVGPHGPVGRGLWRRDDERMWLLSELAKPYRHLPESTTDSTEAPA